VIFRFVIPWYGEIPGGAERECRKTAEGLAARGHVVEVWTTTIKELDSNWNVPYHKEGIEKTAGVTVRRFRSNVTDHGLFCRVNDKALRGEPLTEDEEEAFLRESANSDRLCRALAREGGRGVTFTIPYCFGVTVRASLANPGRTFMIPCLHDEPYARFRVYWNLFRRVRGLVLHSSAERDLARSLHGVPEEKLRLLGEGVDLDLEPDPARFHRDHAPGKRFILVLGRKDATKNTPELVQYFSRYRRRNPESPLSLCLIGSGRVPIPAHVRPWVRDLGFLPRRDVVDAIGAAEALVSPSLNESFSLAVMEAWVCGKPVLVNGACAVTRGFVGDSGGGLWYDDYPTFETALRRLERDEAVRKALGRQGEEFVRRNFAWPVILERYEKLAEEVG
jgi:glycosyltransferase involved in cell wall biosynthesis